MIKNDSPYSLSPMLPCKRCHVKSKRAAAEADGLCLKCFEHPESYLATFYRRGTGVRLEEIPSLGTDIAIP